MQGMGDPGTIDSRSRAPLVPWFSKKHITPNIQSHPIIEATLHSFDMACKVHVISAKDCAIAPIRGNPDFIPGLAKAYLSAEWPYAEMQAKHFFSRGRFLHQSELAALSLTKSFPFWAYPKLKHYLDNPVTRDSFTKTPTVFESLCSGPSSQRHVISVLYAFMFQEPYSALHTECAFWETQLDTVIPEASWDRIHLYIHKGSLNVHTQKNGYNIKTR